MFVSSAGFPFLSIQVSPFQFALTVRIKIYPERLFQIVSPLLYYFCLFFPVFQWTLSVCPRRFSESGCKGTHFFFLSKLFYNFFAIIFWIFFHCVPKRLILNIMLNNMFFQDFGRKSLKSSVRLTKQDSDDGYFHFIVTHIALADFRKT